jgi:hypothetical protein
VNVTGYGLAIFMLRIVQSNPPGLNDTMANLLAVLPYVLAVCGLEVKFPLAILTVPPL